MNAWWHEVWVTLQAEFADIGDASPAAIGVSAGLGREATAVFSTLMALAIFSVMPRVVRLLEKYHIP